MPEPFTLTKEACEKAGACSDLSIFFDSHPDAEGGAIVYTEGFAAEVERLAKEKPIALLWLADHGLVPLSKKDARAAVADAHGVFGAGRVHREYRRRGRAQERTTQP